MAIITKLNYINHELLRVTKEEGYYVKMYSHVMDLLTDFRQAFVILCT